MTNEQLIEKFNPANGKNLSAEDFLAMQTLTDEQITILAKAYPNQPSRRSYIRLYDKTIPANKQLYQLSTWQNLNNLRKYSNKKNLVAYDFLVISAKVVRPVAGKVAPVKRVVVDLTAQEAAAELTAHLIKTKPLNNKKVDAPESFNERMAKAKAEKAAAKLAGKEVKVQDLTNNPPKTNFSVNTKAPADQQFDAGAD